MVQLRAFKFGSIMSTLGLYTQKKLCNCGQFFKIKNLKKNHILHFFPKYTMCFEKHIAFCVVCIFVGVVIVIICHYLNTSATEIYICQMSLGPLGPIF